MSRGRRYDDGTKLNLKKVFATILAFLVIVMAIVLIINFSKNARSNDAKNVSNSYIAACTGNKWGVINSSGNYVIDPIYDNMLIIPDSSKAVFICQRDVDYENGTYKSYAINDKSKELFTSYDSVEAIQNIDKYKQVFYDTNVLKVSKDGKYGLINFNGKELLGCKYDSIEPLSYVKNSFITVMDNKKGLVDNGGNIIIDNLYADIKGLTDKYEDGYIVKNDSSKYGLINYNKKQILECKYNEIMNVAGSEMYVVKEGDDIELINKEGTVLQKNRFNKAVSIENGNVVAINDEKYGIVTSAGEVKVDYQYQFISYMFDQNYIAKKDDKYGIIGVNGETKLGFEYNLIEYLKEEGIIEATDASGKTHLLNTSFTEKASGIVSEVNTRLGYIKVKVEDGFKYYNFKLEEKSVQEVFPANTIFLSKKDGKYGFVNRNKEVVVEYNLEDATEQNEFGYAAIKINGKWGAVDGNGKIVVEPQYSLEQCILINFIGKWHLAPDLNANYYTDTDE